MPAPGTVVNGQFFRRPGVRSSTKDNLASSGAVARNILAIVGIFERLEPKKVIEVSDAAQLAEYLPYLGPRFGPFIYDIPKSAEIKGQPTKVLLVRVNPATQATTVLQSAALDDVLDILAKDWGSYGNAITIQSAAGTAKGRKYTVKLGATTEEFDDVALDVFTLINADATQLADLRLIVDPATGITITYATVAFPIVPGDNELPVPTKLAFDGTLTATLDEVSGDAGTELVITGTNKATGLADSENVPIGAAALAATSVKTWSDVTFLELNNAGVSDSVTITGTAFNLPKATYPTIESVLERIAVYASRGFIGTKKTGLEALVADLDEIVAPGTDCQGAATATATANLYEAERRLADSSLIVATRVTGAATIPAVSGPTSLGAGSEGTTTDAEWQTALDALKTVKCNFVQAMTDTASIQAKVQAHLRYMRADGRDERFTVHAAPIGDDLDELTGGRPEDLEAGEPAVPPVTDFDELIKETVWILFGTDDPEYKPQPGSPEAALWSKWDNLIRDQLLLMPFSSPGFAEAVAFGVFQFDPLLDDPESIYAIRVAARLWIRLRSRNNPIYNELLEYAQYDRDKIAQGDLS